MPPADWPGHSTSYGRTLLLNQDCETANTLLATFTVQPPGLPYFPIMRSKDGGNSWSEISQVGFKATNDSGGGIILQPDLYELPRQIGKYPAGTVLISGNAIPANFSSTNIEVWASLDKG